jgi:hypothetical protein
MGLRRCARSAVVYSRRREDVNVTGDVLIEVVLTRIRARNVETIDVCHTTGYVRLFSCGHGL